MLNLGRVTVQTEDADQEVEIVEAIVMEIGKKSDVTSAEATVINRETVLEERVVVIVEVEVEVDHTATQEAETVMMIWVEEVWEVLKMMAEEEVDATEVIEADNDLTLMKDTGLTKVEVVVEEVEVGEVADVIDITVRTANTEIEVDLTRAVNTLKMAVEDVICPNAHPMITEEDTIEVRVAIITVTPIEVIENMMIEKALTKVVIQEEEVTTIDQDHQDQDDQAIEAKIEDHKAIEAEMVPWRKMERTTRTRKRTIIREKGDIMTMMVLIIMTIDQIKRMIIVTELKEVMITNTLMKWTTIQKRKSKISEPLSSTYQFSLFGNRLKSVF